MRTALCALLLLLAVHRASAQWVTESYPLLSGWNGIWVAQDCSHVTIDDLLAGQSQIEEVWLWNPVGGAGSRRRPRSPSCSAAPRIW